MKCIKYWILMFVEIFLIHIASFYIAPAYGEELANDAVNPKNVVKCDEGKFFGPVFYELGRNSIEIYDNELSEWKSACERPWICDIDDFHIIRSYGEEGSNSFSRYVINRLNRKYYFSGNLGGRVQSSAGICLSAANPALDGKPQF